MIEYFLAAAISMERVAVECAYAMLTPTPSVLVCCGKCKNGVITHGDGHKTQCPCPSGCKCKKDCTKCLTPRN